jgi:hypothetical protein
MSITNLFNTKPILLSEIATNNVKNYRIYHNKKINELILQIKDYITDHIKKISLDEGKLEFHCNLSNINNFCINDLDNNDKNIIINDIQLFLSKEKLYYELLDDISIKFIIKWPDPEHEYKLNKLQNSL